MPKTRASTVLTLRVPDETFRRITKEARRRRTTRSAVLRELLTGAFGGGPALADHLADHLAEARRQSLVVSGRLSERDALRFIQSVTDSKGWR